MSITRPSQSCRKLRTQTINIHFFRSNTRSRNIESVEGRICPTNNTQVDRGRERDGRRQRHIKRQARLPCECVRPPPVQRSLVGAHGTPAGSRPSDLEERNVEDVFEAPGGCKRAACRETVGKMRMSSLVRTIVCPRRRGHGGARTAGEGAAYQRIASTCPICIVCQKAVVWAFQRLRRCPGGLCRVRQLQCLKLVLLVRRGSDMVG